jgi:NAD(P)H-dependent FMN reductase
MAQPKIGIIVSTIREGRFGDTAAQWIYSIASKRTNLAFEIVDLRDYPLPIYGATDPASPDGEAHVATAARWAQKIAELDGYLFVTAEYNHSISGVLKNVLDYPYEEFNKKPAAFVRYGGVGGARAVEHLRLICIELQLAPTRTAVHIGNEPYRAITLAGKQLADFDYLNSGAEATLDELTWWTYTLKAGRANAVVGRRSRPRRQPFSYRLGCMRSQPTRRLC